MIANKGRPNDGPGSNGLRGGKKVYTDKTAIGHWMEEYGGPQGYQRGFHSIDFQTEAQHAQSGATQRIAPEFGAGIKFSSGEKAFTSKEVFVPSKLLTEEEKSKIFQSNYQTMNASAFIDNPKHELKQTITREKLEAYRAKWSSDTEASRKIRFESESRRASYFLGAKFQVPSLRLIPGTPKSLENLRAELIKKYGILAMSILRYNMGRETSISSSKFREVIASLGLPTSTAEVSQIIAYFTPKDEINVEAFMRNIVAKVDGLDEKEAASIFTQICGPDALGTPSMLLIEYLNSDVYPIVAEGIGNSIVVYGDENDTVGRSEFIRLHNDLYVSNPEHYPSVVKKLWNV